MIIPSSPLQSYMNEATMLCEKHTNGMSEWRENHVCISSSTFFLMKPDMSYRKDDVSIKQIKMFK